MLRTSLVLLAIVGTLVIPASFAMALGFLLGESKEELNLEYDVSVYDHDTGRVTVEFTLQDEGRLKPITSVDFHIPSTEKNDNGGSMSDLTMSMALRKEGANQVARVHIRKDWAERAEIQIKTRHLDRKQELATWYYHSIPLKELVARARLHEKVSEPEK
ncbi:hypothetical protein [Blastopirellula marina]|uniref:Uncharacterized protein n=1 Tax=Blastopirellula marina TaxID=124 RepID=A0A2S8GRI1_9BACT|nr:hypothetical protein [Blastopirellula marina]PQO46981.1 hypothetical protein C5Y93_05650 [Blastopirellula marina]